jgi:hypothetical protein
MKTTVFAALHLADVDGLSSSEPPVFTAKCPPEISVEADRAGVVRVNGKKASV